MTTRRCSEFYGLQQRFVFIVPGAEIDPETDLPEPDEFAVVDADDLATIGCPMIGDIELELWAFLEPGENYPGEDE